MQSHILFVLVAHPKSFLIEGINLGETVDSPEAHPIRPESISGNTECRESQTWTKCAINVLFNVRRYEICVAAVGASGKFVFNSTE